MAAAGPSPLLAGAARRHQLPCKPLRGACAVRCQASQQPPRQQQDGQHEKQQRVAASQREAAPAGRRAALALLAAPAAAAALAGGPFAGPAAAAAELELDAGFPSLSSSSAAAEVDTTVTDRLYLDVGLCPEAVRTDRKLGDKTPFCQDPEPLGRIVIGLYGKAAPGSVAILLAAAKAGAYDSTALSKVLPGRYLLLGAQGGPRSGLVQAPAGLPSNPDVLNPAAFRLPHRRPGTVSLNLSETEDEEFARFGDRLSLLITTGPGPVPSLDGENIVVGQVLEGLEVVTAITQVPTFLPNDNARAFNQFASFIGDERAAKTRSKWGRPLQAIVITRAGVL